jgi:hypothetical protein
MDGGVPRARLPAVIEAITLVVHARTECEEEMGRRLTRFRVRRAVWVVRRYLSTERVAYRH